MLSILEGASASTDIGKKVVFRLFGPATLFWAGGIVAAISFYGWGYFSNYFTTLDGYQMVGLALAGFILLMSSDVVMGWLTFPLLQIVEGYWPTLLGDWSRDQLVARVKEKLVRKEYALRSLAGKERARLEAELLSYPADWDQLMPTRVGNLLRAAEEYPNRYGLEANTIWPRLWLVLPEKTQQELSVAWQQLDRATQLLGWGIFFGIWVYFAWWAAPVLLLTVVVAYWRMIHTAGMYGDLIRAAFDLHRFDLYQQMNWPLPENSDMEIEVGKRLTQYIFRGYTEPPITFEQFQSLEVVQYNHAQKSPVATNGMIRQLNGLVESRPSERFQVVDPMPYVVGPPITPESGSPFVGRQELINWIEDRLQEVQKPILVLYGQRRIGKTSLLLQVARGAGGRRLREGREGREGSKRVVYPVYIDLQRLTDLGTELFLFEMAEAIATTVRGRDLEPPPLDPSTGSGHRKLGAPLPVEEEFSRAPYRAFNQFLDRVESNQIDKGLLLLMLDEFEQLEERVADGKVDKDIFNYFRSQMQHRHSIAFLLAGTHRLEEMSRDYQSIIFNLVRHREVSFLKRSEAEELIRKPVHPIVSYDDEAVDKIWLATGGHPYFTQLLCWQLINQMNRRARSNHISKANVEQAIKRIIERGGQQLNYLWDQSRPIEQIMLAAMAQLQDADHSYATPCEIVEQLSPAAPSEADVALALERLVARRVLKRSPSKPARDASYSYSFDLIRQWVSDKHPLYTVLPPLKEG